MITKLLFLFIIIIYIYISMKNVFLNNNLVTHYICILIDSIYCIYNM